MGTVRMLAAAASLGAAALLTGCVMPSGDGGLLRPEDTVTEPCSPPDYLPVDELLDRYPAPLDCNLTGMVLVFADGTELEVSSWLGSHETDDAIHSVANLQRHGLVITVETAADGIEWLGHPGAIALWRNEFDRIDP